MFSILDLFVKAHRNINISSIFSNYFSFYHPRSRLHITHSKRLAEKIVPFKMDQTATNIRCQTGWKQIWKTHLEERKKIWTQIVSVKTAGSLPALDCGNVYVYLVGNPSPHTAQACLLVDYCIRKHNNHPEF